MNLPSAEAARSAWLGATPWTLVEIFEGFTAERNTGDTTLTAGNGAIHFVGILSVSTIPEPDRRCRLG